MKLPLKRIVVVTGHYGSGKTNFTAALALQLAAEGKKVTVVDFDLVNPYFRTADFADVFAEKGITLRAPDFANTNVDIPSVQFDLGGLADAGETLLIDVGGDDDGAVALGRYAHILNSYAETDELDMVAVVSFRRYLTRTAEEAQAYLQSIEQVSRMRLSGIVNNTNLGVETTTEMIETSIAEAEKLSALTGLPLICTVAPDIVETPQTGNCPLMTVPLMVKLPW